MAFVELPGARQQINSPSGVPAGTNQVLWRFNPTRCSEIKLDPSPPKQRRSVCPFMGGCLTFG
jgi:hypothetical protein